ncbi:MAG: DUF5698 domain-containing protein [Bacilli bacterium]|nr:DUF5698 domain-containing protein [Bacilli bacterium]
MDLIKQILGNATVLELVFILVAKAFEVTIGTLRHILVNKGYRKQGAALAFFEITLWVFIASRVIQGIDQAMIKGVIYSLGYALGVYFGSMLENKLAFGKVLIQINTKEELAGIISEVLRDNGLGVTTIAAKGKDSPRVVIMTYTNRKGKDGILNLVHNIDNDAMVTVNDVSSLSGGYVSSWKRVGK